MVTVIVMAVIMIVVSAIVMAVVGLCVYGNCYRNGSHNDCGECYRNGSRRIVSMVTVIVMAVIMIVVSAMAMAVVGLCVYGNCYRNGSHNDCGECYRNGIRRIVFHCSTPGDYHSGYHILERRLVCWAGDGKIRSGDALGNGLHVCFPSRRLSPKLDSGFESRLAKGYSGFSTWHLQKLVIGGRFSRHSGSLLSSIG